MDGLLTVTHHSSNEEDKGSMQADLPLLSEHDVHAIRDITSQFEVDFVALTFTRDGDDVDNMRDFLDKLGLEQTKILAKVGRGNTPELTCVTHAPRFCSWYNRTHLQLSASQCTVNVKCVHHEQGQHDAVAQQ